ncbi:MAG: exodeoxyribonuclease VII large subunit [Candidatus Sulfobium sp.]
MGEALTTRGALSLCELNSIIKSVLGEAFPDTCWVTAEIADLKCNRKGHCYLELVEKEEERIVAQMKATIWAYEYRRIGLKFERVTGEPLKPGMKILFLASVTFHELYGLSLSVRDLDPSYTLGEMARKKKEVAERLRKEGIIDLNKGLPLPLVPQRIAVISSPTAAGYGDFFEQLDKNVYGYRFIHVLFPAVMQGKEAETSIMSAMNDIRKMKERFDTVVIIRGGGSVIDLNCFDAYSIAAEVARFPLPVITGIGHEKDDTVADMVAHTKMKTPTAVAEFLISGLRVFEESIMEIGKRVQTHTQRLLKDGLYRLNTISQRLSYVPLRLSSVYENRLSTYRKDLSGGVKRTLMREYERFTYMEQAIRHLDPQNVLRRGYSITRHRGKTVKDAAALRKWAVIETVLQKGIITSIVQEKKEAAKGGQEQADILLPGFE